MTNVIAHKAATHFAASVIGKSISTFRDLQTVSVSLTYTTKSEPNKPKTKQVDLDFTNMSKFQALRKLRINSKRTNLQFNKVVYDNMNEARWKVIWLDEMGNERDAYYETEEERNARMQSLVYDGYSPVFRDMKEGEAE